MDCKALGEEEEEEGKEDKRGREEEKKRKSRRKMGKWLLSQVVAAGLCSVMSGGNFAVPQRHRSHREARQSACPLPRATHNCNSSCFERTGKCLVKLIALPDSFVFNDL